LHSVVCSTITNSINFNVCRFFLALVNHGGVILVYLEHKILLANISFALNQMRVPIFCCEVVLNRYAGYFCKL
jgi:hypothetical protein